ncbi:MAG: PAS domain-containing protein [Gammaproteobacteria bacterium]|nr:PAS domain-containing protein [Gammaproteobacteria bacterium]
MKLQDFRIRPGWTAAGRNSASGGSNCGVQASARVSLLARLRGFLARLAQRTGSASPAVARGSYAEADIVHAQLLRHTTHFLNFIDRNYRYGVVSDPYLQMHQASGSAIVGRSMADVWGDETFNKLLRPLIDRALAGEASRTEGWLELPGNVRRYHTVEYRPCRDPDGRIFGVVGSGYDLTDYKLAEAALRESEARYRIVTRATNDVVRDWDLQADTVWWNENVATVFGYRREELEPGSESWHRRIHPDDRKRVLDRIYTVIEAGGTSWADEYRFIRADGDTAWVHDRGYIIHDQAGKPARMIGAMMDITERRRAEEERANLASRNEGLVQALGEIVYEVWPLEDRVQWGGEYTRILGYTPEEIGHDRKSWQPRVHPDDLERVLAELKRAKSQGGLFSVEYRFRRKNGEYLWMQDRGKMFLNASGDRVRTVGVFKDISERKRSEENLRANERRLQLALEALDGGVFEWNLQTGETYRSPSWLRMLGYVPGEIEDNIEGWLNLLHPDDRPRVLQEQKKHFAGVTPALSYEYRLRTQSGEWLWTATRGRVTERAEDGAPLRVIGANINITERRLAEARLEREAREQEFIGLLGRMLLEKHDLDAIFDATVLGLAEIINTQFAKILELLPSGDALLLRAGHGWRAGLVRTATVPAGRDSQAGYTLLSREAVVVEDLRTESRFRGPALLTDHGVVSGMSVIIGDATRPYGVLGVHTSVQRRFEPHDVQFLENVANIVAEAINARHAEQIVLQSRERLRKLAARMDRSREEDHRRIAREIHDELGQTLTGLRIDLAWMLDRLPRDRPELAERALSALTLADQTLDTVRRMSHDLRPAMLDDLGLEAAMEWQVSEFSRRTGCRCRIDLRAGPIGLDNERDTTVFRVLQEALTNVARHAAADELKVTLRAPNERLMLEVTDNGRGISDEAIRSNESIGLIGMRERVGALGGRINITRGRKGGTIVHMEMPLHRH